MAKDEDDNEFEEDEEKLEEEPETIEESEDAEEELEEEDEKEPEINRDIEINGKEMINTEIAEEVKKSYLDYAMSVIVSRALPSIEDGLKPVQRRILYSMNLLGLQSNKQTKKSARIVGDVLGKYHPHGDVAVYDALVRMAQKFSLRYPLVFGQGNFGSVDGDPPAAMRYCVTGDSLIITENGLEKINKISSNEELNLKILSKDKKVHNASKWFDSGEHETIKITTDKGYSLAGSKNHPILMLSKNIEGKPIFVWKLLEEIKEGDIAVIDRREDTFWPENEVNLKEYWPQRKNGHQHVKKLPQNLNEDLAFILGALISEGSISLNKIEFCNTDEKFIQEFEDKWKKTFPDSRMHKFRRLPSSYGKREYYRLECHSRYSIEFLRNIGLLPVKADIKNIPPEILNSPKNVAASFLRAYFEGDGSMSYSRKMNELSCCSKSRKLLNDIQVFLLRFGIDGIQRFDRYKNINKLLLRGKRNLLRFYKDINFFSERKRKKLEFVLVNYKRETTLKDFVPFLSDFIRRIAGYSDNEFALKHNFDRYYGMRQNYQRISSVLLKNRGVDCLSLFEYLLTYEYLFDSVTKVENNGIQRVYSIKVDSDCHSFISNGFVSHNTEAKLSPMSSEIIEDIDKETVKFVPNFDNSMKEPELLPSKLPNLIINGASGIAVGMATNIPPHNLSEICDAITAYIKDENITIEQLCEIVTGPDFPTGGALSGDIVDLYTKGKGRLVLRGKISSEESKGKERIVITEIPYMLNKSTLVEQIAALIQNKKLLGVTDLRDESSKGKIRIVLELKKGVNSKYINNMLYKYTRLQDSFNANFLALVGAQPRVLTLKQIIEEYVKYRKQVVTARTVFELKKAKDRLEIVEGLLVALKHLNEIIAIIKRSREEAAENLIKRFNFTKRQAEAILETKLRQLTALEQDKLKEENEKLKINITEYEKILADVKEVLKIIAKEVKSLKEKYGDERKTQVMRRIGEIAEKDLVQKKDVIVTITEKGYCKRIDANTYKEQRRGGKGVIGNNLATGDFVKKIISCSTHDYLMFFTSKGRVLFIKVYEIPEADRYAKGKAIINLIGLKDETVTNIIAIHDFNDSLFMVTKKGFVKKASLSHFSKPRASGIRAINLPMDNSDSLIDAQIIKSGEEVLLATKKGQAIRFSSNDVRLMGRASYGVTGIRMEPDDEVVSLEILRTKEVLTITHNGYGKRTAIEDYRKTARGGKGVINVKVSEKTGDVVTTISINPQDKIIITTGKGMVIRTNLDNIRVMGRATQGVRIVKMQEGDYVTDLVRVENGVEGEE